MGKHHKIIAEIERAIARLENRPGLCLYYAHHTVRILWRHGYRAVIQAGSLQWPRLAVDDGGNTHFSYMWSPNDLASQVSARMGGLPEMHCWVGIVDQPRNWWTSRRGIWSRLHWHSTVLDGHRAASVSLVPSQSDSTWSRLSTQSRRYNPSLPDSQKAIRSGLPG